ncbi:MAG: hypothetical protein FWH52_07100 [Synergistaceae bacterium]|nr:hypothetical protein [Synergistaceae bacterium]
MIRFIKENKVLLLNYKPDSSVNIINAKLGISFTEDGTLTEYSEDSLPLEMKNLRGSFHKGFSLLIKRTFSFNRTDLIYDKTDEGEYVFALGFLSDNYYRIKGRIFGILHDVLMHESMKFDLRLFCTGSENRTSILGKIDKLIHAEEQVIIIGGERENAIPEDEYLALVDNFPNTYELERIADARIAGYIQDYLETKKDYITVYEKYSKRKRSEFVRGMTLSSNLFNLTRLEAFKLAHSKLYRMLEEKERISEELWQQGILELIPILFPQYIYVFPNVKISDKVNPEADFREIDFLLVDASGNV